MFEKLNSLIFGNEEFEKVKIENRFQEAQGISNSLKINSLKDFEIVENCIFKIKELLRLKSSNLNKAINDPSRKIKKKEVLELLENLENIKTQYLQNKTNSTQNNTNNNLETKKSLTSENNNDILIGSIEILNTKEFNLILSNAKIPYILIEFKTEINYSIIKRILTVFFEEYMPEGTNIITEENSVLIIPRKNSDNIISFPSPSININEIYDKIIENKTSKQNKTNKISKTKQKTEEKKEIKNKTETTSVVNNKEKEEDYIPVEKITEKPQKKSLRNKEESLDNLLEAINKKITKVKEPEDPSARELESQSARELEGQSTQKSEEITNSQKKPEIKEEKVTMEIIPDEKIEIQKKSKAEILKEEIIVEKKPIEQNILNNNVSFSKASSDDEGYDLEDHSLYIDDKIKVYLESKSKTAYEIVITTINEEKIANINESTFSYMMIFSKVFSQILFEETKPDGTNLIWDYSRNKLRIICRREKDGLKLNWQLKDASDDFLEQVKNKLFSVMTKGIGDKENRGLGDKEIQGQQSKGTKVEKVTGEVMSSTKEERQENKDKLKDTQDRTLEDRARIILESLRRIP